jgi:hypothetical protein
MLYYNEEPVNIVPYFFTSFSLKIQNMFTDFTKDNINFLIRIAFYDPQLIIPAFSSIPLQINLKPENGTISISPLEGFSLSTPFTLTLSGYQDEDAPFVYKFQFY